MITENDEQLIYTIGLALLNGIGPVNARRLLQHCGEAREVFKAKKSTLLQIPGIGEYTASCIDDKIMLRAEEEWRFIEKNNIRAMSIMHPDYPQRLFQCEDAPTVLYCKGSHHPEGERMVSIVGTRYPSEQGKKFCEELIGGLAQNGIRIVSGLAYGIDICAHRACLKNEVTNFAVLAHGLDRIYPTHHFSTAEHLLENGAWISEYTSKTNPDRENFPQRNRIIAGLCDATVVIETGYKGGSIITAMIANEYNRDVFAMPGRPGDDKTAGCNRLIKINRAGLIENAGDFLRMMGWDKKTEKRKAIQTSFFPELDGDEKILMEILKEKGNCSADFLCLETAFTPGKVSTVLLGLEFKGLVKSLAGKRYELL
ncbi:MAG: DNA-processing protein DprA [Flavobacteriales bacterium]|nr:DNA-processing protein DprA [Flavobacteriales bacterium]